MTKAVCPICRGRYALTAAGLLRAHWEAGTSHRCTGSGTPGRQDGSGTR